MYMHQGNRTDRTDDDPSGSVQAQRRNLNLPYPSNNQIPEARVTAFFCSFHFPISTSPHLAYHSVPFDYRSFCVLLRFVAKQTRKNTIFPHRAPYFIRFVRDTETTVTKK